MEKSIHRLVMAYHEALRKSRVTSDSDDSLAAEQLAHDLRARMPEVAEHVAVLADALSPFAALADGKDGWPDEQGCGTFAPMSIVRAARSALAGDMEPTPEVSRLRAAVGTADRLLVAVESVLKSPLATIGPSLERMAKLAAQFNQASVATLPRGASRRTEHRDDATHIYITKDGVVSYSIGGLLTGPAHSATMVVRAWLGAVTVLKDQTSRSPISRRADLPVPYPASQYLGVRERRSPESE